MTEPSAQHVPCHVQISHRDDHRVALRLANMEEISTPKAQQVANVAYTMIGISILTIQRSMVLKNGLQKRINQVVGDLTTTLERFADFRR